MDIFGLRIMNGLLLAILVKNVAIRGIMFSVWCIYGVFMMADSCHCAPPQPPHDLLIKCMTVRMIQHKSN